MPSRLAWKWKSPNVRLMPSQRASNARLRTGECGVKSKDPKQIKPMGVEDPKLDEDEAGETVDPARAVPTDGTKCRCSGSTYPSYDILGFRDMETDAHW